MGSHWALLAAAAMPQRRSRRPWRENRAVLNGILWILRTGAPWPDLPDRYPSYQTCHRRFQQWVQAGVLKDVLSVLADALHDEGFLDVQEALIDGSFAPADDLLAFGGLRLATRLEQRQKTTREPFWKWFAHLSMDAEMKHGAAHRQEGRHNMNRHLGATKGWMFGSNVILLSVAILVITSSPSQGNTFGTLYISTDTNLTENHDGDVVITTDNVTLDCGRHVISADLPVGILLQNRSGVTIRNCQVFRFTRGVLILNSVRNTLS